MIVLLDTNVIIDVLRGHAVIRDFIFQLVNERHILASCPIVLAELHAGMRSHETKRTTEFLQTLRYYDLTRAAAIHAGQMKAVWASKGRILALDDLFIAAIALEKEIYLATNNRKDFPMPDLKLLPVPLPQ